MRALDFTVSKRIRTKTYEQTWLRRRKCLPDDHSYLVCGEKLAGYDQTGQVIVRYVFCHGNFAYALSRRKGVEATKDLVVSRKWLASQRMGMAGRVQLYLFEDFIMRHQNKLLRDALWRAQDEDLVYDPRLSPETLALIARDLKVAAPPMDPELAKHAAADQCEPEV